jgi:hypothetical protein
MVRPLLLATLLALPALAQDPFQPLDFSAQPGAQDLQGARADWVKLTNARLQMAGREARVAVEQDGQCAVFLVPKAQRKGHAKSFLNSRPDGESLFRSAAALGFTRLVVRNPDTRKEWGGRIDRGKPAARVDWDD